MVLRSKEAAVRQARVGVFEGPGKCDFDKTPKAQEVGRSDLIRLQFDATRTRQLRLSDSNVNSHRF